MKCSHNSKFQVKIRNSIFSSMHTLILSSVIISVIWPCCCISFCLCCWRCLVVIIEVVLVIVFVFDVIFVVFVVSIIVIDVVFVSFQAKPWKIVVHLLCHPVYMYTFFACLVCVIWFSSLPPWYASAAMRSLAMQIYGFLELQFSGEFSVLVITRGSLVVMQIALNRVLHNLPGSFHGHTKD